LTQEREKKEKVVVRGYWNKGSQTGGVLFKAGTKRKGFIEAGGDLIEKGKVLIEGGAGKDSENKSSAESITG